MKDITTTHFTLQEHHVANLVQLIAEYNAVLDMGAIDDQDVYSYSDLVDAYYYLCECQAELGMLTHSCELPESNELPF